jgi:hypothetical protein
MATHAEIDGFHRFALQQVDDGGAELSMDQLYSLWRGQNPTQHELDESVAALEAAYADLQAGDAGRPAREALRETCERLGVVIDA